MALRRGWDGRALVSRTACRTPSRLANRRWWAARWQSPSYSCCATPALQQAHAPGSALRYAKVPMAAAQRPLRASCAAKRTSPPKGALAEAPPSPLSRAPSRLSRSPRVATPAPPAAPLPRHHWRAATGVSGRTIAAREARQHATSVSKSAQGSEEENHGPGAVCFITRLVPATTASLASMLSTTHSRPSATERYKIQLPHMGTSLIFRINRQIFRINRQIFLVLSFDLVDQWSAGHEASAGLPASRAAGRLARGVRTLFPTSFYSLQPMRNPCAAQVPDAPLGIPRGAPSRRTPTGTGSCGCVRGVAPCAPFAASLAPPRAPHAPRRHPTMLGLADKRVQAAPRASWAGAATRGALQIQGKGGPVSLAGGCRVGQATRVRVRGARPNDTTAPQMRSACRRVRKTRRGHAQKAPCHSVAPYPFLRPTCKQPQLRERSAPCKGPCARACIALRGPTALSRKADGGGAPPRARCDVPARTSFARAGLK